MASGIAPNNITTGSDITVIRVESVIGPDGMYTMRLTPDEYYLITHSVVRYQMHLESANRYQEKKRVGPPKRAGVKNRPRVLFDIRGQESTPDYVSNLHRPEVVHRDAVAAPVVNAVVSTVPVIAPRVVSPVIPTSPVARPVVPTPSLGGGPRLILPVLRPPPKAPNLPVIPVLRK